MTYSAQHNGRGKYHLIPDPNQIDEDDNEGNDDSDSDSDSVVCGSAGEFLFTKAEDVAYDPTLEEFFEVYNGHVTNSFHEADYCKKCLKRVRKR